MLHACISAMYHILAAVVDFGFGCMHGTKASGHFYTETTSTGTDTTIIGKEAE